MSASAIKAGRAYVEIFTEDSRLVSGLRKAGGHLKAWGKTTASLGAQLLAGSGALIAPLMGAAAAFAAAGSQLAEASIRTGVSVEALSELQYAAKQTGVEFDGLEAGIRLMQKTIGGGGKKFEALADAVGIPMAKLKAMKPEEQFLAISDAISKSTDPTKRAALAMQAFGKQGASLLPLIDDGAAGIEKLRKEARDLGLVMSTKDAQAADAFGDALDQLWAQGVRVAHVVGAAIAPALTTLLKWTQPIIKSVIDWVDANRGLIANFTAILAGVAAVGASLVGMGVGMQVAGMAVGPLISGFRGLEAVLRFTIGTGGRLVKVFGTPVVSMMKWMGGLAMQAGAAFVALAKGGIAAFMSGMSGVGSAIAAVLTPIGVIGLALAAIGGYALYASGTFQVLWSEGKAALSALWEIATTSFSAIGNALAKGDIVQAAAVLWTSLQLAWIQGIRPLQMAWWTFKNFFQQVWANAVFNVASVFVNAWAGVKSIWTSTIAFMQQGWLGFTGMLQKAWHSTIGFIKTAWVKLKKVFGADVNVNAEVDRINAETDAANKAVDDDNAARSAETERQKQADLAGIESQRAGTLAALGDMSSAEQAAMQKEFDDSVASADAKLADARSKWQANVDQANAAAEETPEAKEREGLIAKAGTTSKKTKEHVNSALELGSSEALKAIVGAVTPEAALQKTIAESSKSTAKNTKTLVAEVGKTNKALGELPTLTSGRV